MSLKEHKGYLDFGYAESLSEFGDPLPLQTSGAWLLKRPIPETPLWDAMGGYPLFSCDRWDRLGDDMAALGDSLVSVTVVTDPFGEYTEDDLKTTFPDLVLPFKPHFIVDFKAPLRLSSHHRYYAKQALKTVTVTPCLAPMVWTEEWNALYRHLVARHNLRGLKAFSKKSFEQQLAIPGMVGLLAFHEERLVGAHLWLVKGKVAYSHLAASSDKGYELSVSYALYAKAMEYFQGSVRWLDLGGGAGTGGNSDGLAQFKRGWANGERLAYLCGRILNRPAYEELRRKRGGERYFPSYRVNEKGQF